MALRWVTTVSSPCSSQSHPAADAAVPKFSSSKTLHQSHRTFTSPLFSTNRLSLSRNTFNSTARIPPLRCFASALTPQLKNTLDTVVTSNKVVLFMKGTKDFPQCGFSNTVALKEYSSWPTFPQLYIDGEFFGGCDITVEAYQNGQLQEQLEKAMCS
ncbi:hypothetical protein V6N13_140758 [Hibiscus sabdariffa]|uniref:Glutaredoxin domain-containing protein n=1 Tax=Hibiscus sabdariffa TaxID=183260 RepID=A0ABR2Q2H4_9ROSI